MCENGGDVFKNVFFLHKEGNIGEKERKLLLSMKRKEENESMLDQSPSCR